MKEENKKRINKLIIPFTKRTLSFLTAATILATGTVGCKDKKENEKDTSSTISSISDEEITSSDKDLTIDYSSSSINNESSKNEQSNNEISNNITSSNKNNSTNNNSSKNNQTNNTNTNNNQSSSVNTSTPSITTSSTPSEPIMPSTLTASNINDVEVFKYFAEKFRYSSSEGAVSLTFRNTYNGETYKTDGVKEFQLALFLLNHKYVSSDLFNSLFGDCTTEEMNKHISFIHQIPHLASTYHIDYDFEKLCLEKNVGKFLSEFTKEYWIIIEQMNNDKFDNMVSQYFVTKDQPYYYGSGNFWADYYVCALSGYANFYIKDINLVMTFQKNDGYNDYLVHANNVISKLTGKSKIYIKE